MPIQTVDFPKRIQSIDPLLLDSIISLAIREDLGTLGDITTQALLERLEKTVSAEIIAKEDGVICGVEVLREVYKRISTGLEVTTMKYDGETVHSGDVIVHLSGKPSWITSGERVALNFLGLMSGVATKTRKYARLLEGTPTRLLDTRKTLPGLREFQKYAVLTGGGCNHRIGLYDMVLIKENHIAAVGSISRAVELAKRSFPETVVEIEVESMEQVAEALKTEADVVMLDNMDNSMVEKAFSLLKGKKLVEVSGNITEERLSTLGKIGVDFVSMGALTHTVKPLDISLLIKE